MTDAVTTAEGLWERTIEPRQGGPENLDIARKEIKKAANVLNDLSSRAEEMLFGGRSDEFLEGVSSVGYSIFKAAMLNLRVILPEAAGDFINLGVKLHSIETSRLYLDGGQSQRNLEGQVTELRGELVQLFRLTLGE